MNWLSPALRDKLSDLLSLILLALLAFIILWTIEQGAREYGWRQYGTENILPTPAPAIENAEHFPS